MTADGLSGQHGGGAVLDGVVKGATSSLLEAAVSLGPSTGDDRVLAEMCKGQTASTMTTAVTQLTACGVLGKSGTPAITSDSE